MQILPYKYQYAVAWGVFIAGLLLAGAKLFAMRLGLVDPGAAVVDLLLFVIVGLQPFLPKITKPPDSERTGLD